MPLLFILFAASCKKEGELPEASQSGANIMAAKINGKKWEKKACWSCIGGGSGLRVNYYDDNYFGISGQNRESGYTISIVILSLNGTGRYEFGDGKSLNTTDNHAAVYSMGDTYITLQEKTKDL